MVENSLKIHGDEILYVGDHIYTDVSVSKVHLRWRTALICRELEEEVCVSISILIITSIIETVLVQCSGTYKDANTFDLVNAEKGLTCLI